jgi:tetratricopeptide (TPR) repeat protein
MPSKISLWAGPIGIGVIITLGQSIAFAKNSVDLTTPPTSSAIAISVARGQGSGDYFSSGLRKQKQGDDRGALADYNRAIRLNSRNANAYYNRGLLKATKLQDDQGALADYNRAIQLKPNYDAAYNNRANLKAALQDYPGALADYNRSIQLKPRNANAYYNRGVLKYTNLNDRAGGIADLQRAAKLSQRQGNTQDAQAASDLLQQWQQTSGS